MLVYFIGGVLWVLSVFVPFGLGLLCGWGARRYDTDLFMLYVTTTRVIASDLLRRTIGLDLVSCIHACIKVLGRRLVFSFST